MDDDLWNAAASAHREDEKAEKKCPVCAGRLAKHLETWGCHRPVTRASYLCTDCGALIKPEQL